MSGFEPDAALTHLGDARRCTLDMGLGCWALLGPLTSAFFAPGLVLVGASLFDFGFPTSPLELGELAMGGWLNYYLSYPFPFEVWGSWSVMGLFHSPLLVCLADIFPSWALGISGKPLQPDPAVGGRSP